MTFRLDRGWMLGLNGPMKKLIICSLVLVAGCKSAPVKTEVSSAIPKDSLTQAEAIQRSDVISDTAYELHVRLEDQLFHGDAKVHFKLKQVPASLRLNFKSGADISTISINGQPQQTSIFEANHITLPAVALRSGDNTVAVSYSQKYSKTGRGLYRFQDPEDKRVYLYTHFEPNDAHHLFPCFDQPDLKATMKMTVTAPEKWNVITTTRESKITKNGDLRIWDFPVTPKISTYLFSLHAGEYHKWEDKSGRYPVRLFARESLAKYVDTKDWFLFTKQGIRFFESYFSSPYPFKKYDHVLIPDSNSGAMENPGAVTYNEYLVPRGPVPDSTRESHADILLHEMAHMWFGDLVTMKWWNDLWLNESFATYMSSVALQQGTEFKKANVSFFAKTKQWASQTDQSIVTHPIEANIPDTDSALANFDAITYGKGASVLKQLSYYLTEEKFKLGLKHYFHTHAFSNTERKDFIASLEKASGKDLSLWTQQWLQTSGVDTVKIQYTCDKNRISSLILTTLPPSPQTQARTHRTEVGLFKLKRGKVQRYKSLPIVYGTEGAKVKAAEGLACPDMVYGNVNDHDYAKFQFDVKSLAFVKEHLQDIQDPFMRMMVWPNLYEMVRDGDLAPRDYLDIVLKQYPLETDVKIAESFGTVFTILYYLPQFNSAQVKESNEYQAKIEEMFWQKALASAPGSDWQKFAFGSFNGVALSDAAAKRLAGMLDGSIKLKGFVLDPDKRWRVVTRLSSLNYPGSDQLIEQEAAHDKSQRGVQSTLGAQAAKPDLANKKKWIQKTLTDKSLSMAENYSILGWLLPGWQDDLRAELASSFYQNLKIANETNESNFVAVFASSTAPLTCNLESADQFRQFLNAKGETYAPLVTKSLKMKWEEHDRCARLRTKFGKFESVKN